MTKFSRYPLLYLLAILLAGATLIEEQLLFPKVRQAKKTEAKAKKLFSDAGVPWGSDLFLRGFKFEKELELWGESNGQFRLIKSYPICAMSGDWGPKRRQGDRQVPEGIYSISLFNPASNFHLSMKVDYPNKSDRIRSNASDLGGDIFIHGNCASIGCISIEDNPIEELYWILLQSANATSELPVHIFPCRMDFLRYRIKDHLRANTEASRLWKELLLIYREFEETKIIPRSTINNKGAYVLVH